MHAQPSSNAVGLSMAGLAMLSVGVALGLTPVIAWGAGIWIGIGFARALTLLQVNRARTAGFEMLWQAAERSARIGRGESLILHAEIRNRATHAVRYSHLSVVADANLQIELSPTDAEIPPQRALVVEARVTGLRVGRHGIHGLALQLSSGSGLFSVPLTFANPFGLEVLPRAYLQRARSAVGGRSRRESQHGKARRRRGEGGEFSEIRDHQAGDPFKRIAWRASARRGKLLVRDFELEEHAVVWLVLDASHELWAGAPGSAPLDLAIDEFASLADRHLAQGDSVGLAIVGSRVLQWLPPQPGVSSLGKLMTCLAFDTHNHDADRSGLDEHEAAAWVLEHMRPLEPRYAARIASHQVDRIARRAAALITKAPFSPPPLVAGSERERALRRYLAAFGVSSPARLQADRPKTDLVIADTLSKIAQQRPHATHVYLCSPVPDAAAVAQLEAMLRKLPPRHYKLDWVQAHYEPALDALHTTSPSSADRAALQAVTDALKLRMRTRQKQGETSLRRLGVRLTRPLRANSLAARRMPTPEGELP